MEKAVGNTGHSNAASVHPTGNEDEFRHQDTTGEASLDVYSSNIRAEISNDELTRMLLRYHNEEQKPQDGFIFAHWHQVILT
jgi:hypothetical protein